MFIYFGHKDGLVKGCLVLVDDGDIDVICLVEGSDHDVVLDYAFFNICCCSVVESEW